MLVKILQATHTAVLIAFFTMDLAARLNTQVGYAQMYSDYRNDFKFSDRQVWAYSVDPEGAVWSGST